MAIRFHPRLIAVMGVEERRTSPLPAPTAGATIETMSPGRIQRVNYPSAASEPKTFDRQSVSCQ